MRRTGDQHRGERVVGQVGVGVVGQHAEVAADQRGRPCRLPPPVMLSALATGVLSFTGVMVIVTVAVLLVWLPASVTW